MDMDLKAPFLAVFAPKHVHSTATEPKPRFLKKNYKKM